jgi:hypothetical protein
MLGAPLIQRPSGRRFLDLWVGFLVSNLSVGPTRRGVVPIVDYHDSTGALRAWLFLILLWEKQYKISVTNRELLQAVPNVPAVMHMLFQVVLTLRGTYLATSMALFRQRP